MVRPAPRSSDAGQIKIGGANMAEKMYNKGDIVFSQGEFGDSFYQVAEGAVQIAVKGEGGETIVLTDLGAGDFFGEMAVLDVYPRSANAVVTADGTKLLEFSSKDMDLYFSSNPDQALALIQHLGNRLRALTKEYTEVNAVLAEIEKGDKSEGLLARLRRFLAFPLRGNLEKPTAEERRTDRVIDGYAGKVECWPAGTVIFREGDPANCMYDIHFGSVGIYAAYGTPDEKLMTELGVDQFFGEMGLVAGEPRSATAVVLSDNTTLEIIDMEELKALMEKNPPEVWAIVSHLSGRLRKLTRNFMDACEKAHALQH